MQNRWKNPISFKRDKYWSWNPIVRWATATYAQAQAQAQAQVQLITPIKKKLIKKKLYQSVVVFN